MFKGDYPAEWPAIAKACKDEAGWCCIRCTKPHSVEGARVLTVHHFNGDKSNCAWWNLLALCQRCHLSFQSRVNPEVPYMFEHKEWLKPYVAGFYAWKYQGKLLTRAQVMEQLDELLAHERLA